MATHKKPNHLLSFVKDNITLKNFGLTYMQFIPGGETKANQCPFKVIQSIKVLIVLMPFL